MPRSARRRDGARGIIVSVDCVRFGTERPIYELLVRDDDSNTVGVLFSDDNGRVVRTMATGIRRAIRFAIARDRAERGQK